MRSSPVTLRLGAGKRPLLAAGRIVLGPVAPLVNGAPLPDWQLLEWPAVLEPAREPLRWRFSSHALGAGSFTVSIHRDPDAGSPWLEYRLDGAPAGLVLDSFGIRFEQIAGVRSILRQGYHSWDGSALVPIAGLGDGESATGYALTQLLPDGSGDNLVLGFDRHDRFQQTFTFRRDGDTLSLDVTTAWDRKPLDGRGRATGERLYLCAQPGVEAGLRRWAELVAAAAPEPPRVAAQAITGWCSWYNHYASISAASTRAELRGAAAARDEHGLRLEVFQIDDGFTPEMGDWLEVKPQFDAGMKPLLSEIRAAGFRPGLWIAPFIAGNRSRLYEAHPDWVVRDRETGGPLVLLRFYGEFRWHKRSEEYYLLDTTHPEAFAYLRRVFRTWARDWGCDYFKTDFMYYGGEYGPDRALYHTPGLTRIEIWRRVASMIREEIGDALWLGCGCPLWPAVGLADGVRVGRDMGVSWAGERPAQSILGDLQLRNFANGILWHLDPDCLLLRDRYHYLSDVEIRSLALYAGLAAGVIMTSDTLAELPPDRLALLRFLLDLPPGTGRFPLLGEQDGDQVVVLLRSLGHTAETLLFAFNTGDEPVTRAIDLTSVGIDTSVSVRDWPAGEWFSLADTTLQVSLAAHEGRLWVLTPAT